MRRQALAKAAHQREQELADERLRRDKLARADARNREEERVRKAEEHRLQVRLHLRTRVVALKQRESGEDESSG